MSGVIPAPAGIKLLSPLPYGERVRVRGKMQSVFYVCYPRPNPPPARGREIIVN
jgi:hypothetical protein